MWCHKEKELREICLGTLARTQTLESGRPKLTPYKLYNLSQITLTSSSLVPNSIVLLWNCKNRDTFQTQWLLKGFNKMKIGKHIQEGIEYIDEIY